MLKFLASTILFISVGLQAQVKFLDIPWEEALAKSSETKKPIFVNAIALWSEPSQLFEKYTLSDLEVANFFNEKFICVQLDMEQYPGIELAEQYEVTVYPSVLFINADGRLIHRGCGAMDAGELLEVGADVFNEKHLFSYQKRFKDGERGIEFLFEYFELADQSCLDTEKLSRTLFNEVKLKDLTSEYGYSIIEAFQWDIYSREFKHLTTNRSNYENQFGKERVNQKIYDTYLAQYQEIYASEELHLFGMRALLDEIRDISFAGSDTLLTMINLHYYELVEDWNAFSSTAELWVGMQDKVSTEEINDLGWKFYLFVDESKKLSLATGWLESIIEEDPSPSLIDTYASLLFKQGEKKKAIALEKQALEMAESLSDDISHYEYQLRKFQKK